MKVCFLSISIILILISSCNFSFDWKETSEWFTRMVIVQTEDGTPCPKAIMVREYGIRDTLYADRQGKLPISIKSKSWSDSIGYSFTIFKDETNIHKWQGRIYYYKGNKYKEFLIEFPNE